MTKIVDPDRIEARTLRDVADIRGRRVLEVGCGEGRVTFLYARDAASVLALDPDLERIAEARSALPADLAGRIRFEAASILELELPPERFDLALLPWSL